MLVYACSEAAGDILGKAKINSIKRHDQIFSVVDLFKCADDTRLTTDCPGEIFMCHRILQAHTLLVDRWQVILMDSRQIISIEAKIADDCQLSTEQHRGKRVLTILPASCTLHLRTYQPFREEWRL